MTFPSISPRARGRTRPCDETDSAGLPTRLPVEVQEWSNGISPLMSSVFGSSDSKSSTPGGSTHGPHHLVEARDARRGV